jgi:hypothetical protein
VSPRPCRPTIRKYPTPEKKEIPRERQDGAFYESGRAVV